MMTDLNELFEQILYSEKKFTARVDELKSVALEVEQCQACIQEVREEVHSKQGEEAVKRNKLADQEVETKILQIRKEILRKQADTLLEEKIRIENEAVEIETKQELSRITFVDELSKFSQHYDLLGSGCKHRVEKLKKISLLQEELLLLESELVEIKWQQEEVKKLEVLLTETNHDLAIANKDLDELVKIEKDVEKVTISLEGEKSSMDQTLFLEPEFVRLQKELEFCKGSTGEATCQQLSKEFDDLQKQCYHKQMKQRLTSKKGAHQNTVAHSSCKTGHYNPYTLEYVPAPNYEQLLSSTTEAVHIDQYCEGGGENDNSLPEWDIEMDDDDTFFVECKDQPELEDITREIRKGKPLTWQLPPSNFSATKSQSSSTSCLNDFTQASSVKSKRAATHVQTVSTSRHPSTSSRRSTTAPFQHRNQSRSSLDSPGPQLTRKRQGESIVKTAVAQDSNLPRRAKKVRFHY